MKNRVKSIILVIVTLIASFNSLPIVGFAKERQIYQDEQRKVYVPDSFVKSRGSYTHINKKLEEEASDFTGKLDKKVEKLLNEKGIFDDELERCSEQSLEELEKYVDENSIVYVAYYAVDDSEQLKEEPVKEEEMILLTDKQVNEYLGEKYYGIKTNLKEELTKKFEKTNKDKHSISESLMGAVGIGVEDAYAKTIAKGGKSDKNNPTMLKKTLVISELNDGKHLHVWFNFMWTEMPEYRELDSVSLSWDGAYYDFSDSYSSKTAVSHTWSHESYNITNGKKNDYKYSQEQKQVIAKGNPAVLKADQYHIRSNYICCAIELHDDKMSGNGRNYYKNDNYLNEAVTMVVYLKKEKGYGGVIFYPYYLHAKSNYDWLSVAISIAEKGLLSAVYTITSGKVVNITFSYSGVDEPFPYKYK